VTPRKSRVDPVMTTIVPAALTARIAGGFAVVSIGDEGRGCPEGRQVELFGMFVRGEQEGSAPGAGLGLAICRSIVDAHGGTIRAANRVGGGAELTFTLPLGTPPSIEDEADPLHKDRE
jgi:two-component system sensor histidine kinase KdpD